MSISTLVRTSFVLSGLLGIKFDGIPDGRGGFKSLEAAVPFQTPCYKTLTQLFAKAGNNIPPQKNLFKLSNKNTIVLNKPNKNQKEIPLSDNNTKNIKSCGDSKCKKNEICITWKKIDSASISKSKSKRGQKNIFRECQKDGGLLDPKINPNFTQICPTGETHAIQNEPQPCLKDDPPCSLSWTYKCVEESESPHSCSLKKCPSGGCLEQVSCGLELPCLLEAVCFGGF